MFRTLWIDILLRILLLAAFRWGIKHIIFSLNYFYSSFAHALIRVKVVISIDKTFVFVSEGLFDCFIDGSNAWFYSFNPARVVPDYVLVIKFRHGLYLFIYVMSLYVLVDRKMNPDLFYSVYILVQTMSRLKNWSKSALSKWIKSFIRLRKTALL